MVENQSDWCILRTGEASTLRLVEMLNSPDVNIEAWTPIVMKQGRVPRSHVKAMMRTALAPSFAFARYDDLPRLIAMSRIPTMRPRFSVFRYRPPGSLFDVYPRVRDVDLDKVRKAEAEYGAKTGGSVLAVGDSVRVEDASFEGLTGTIHSVHGVNTMVIFPGCHLKFQFPSWQVKGVRLKADQP